MFMHKYLLSPLKINSLVDNNPDYKFIRDYILIALHIGFAPNMYISTSLGKSLFEREK